MSKPKYDSTVARIAGNILSDISVTSGYKVSDVDRKCVEWAVAMAREIVAEVQRTEPGAEVPHP